MAPSGAPTFNGLSPAAGYKHKHDATDRNGRVVGASKDLRTRTIDREMPPCIFKLNFLKSKMLGAVCLPKGR